MSHNQLHIKYQLLQQGTVSKLASEMASKFKMRYFLTRFYLVCPGFDWLLVRESDISDNLCIMVVPCHTPAWSRHLGVGLPAASLHRSKCVT